MEIFDSTKSIVENLYFLSGPLLLFTIILGILQLKSSKKINSLTREAIIINSKRDSIKLAIEQDIYLKQKITSIDFELNKLRRAKSEVLLSSFYENEILKNFTKSEMEGFGEEKLYEYLMVALATTEGVLSKMLELVYSLNTVAKTFNSRVADDETGFSIIGTDFCDYVEDYYPIIAMLRENESDIIFSDIKTLYSRWKNMIIKHNTNLEIDKLSKKIKNTIDVKIDPLGTE